MSDSRKVKAPETKANGEINGQPSTRNQYHAVAPLEDSVETSKKEGKLKPERVKRPQLVRAKPNKKRNVLIKLLGLTVIYFVYVVVGGIVFSYIESPEEKIYLYQVEKWKNDTAILLATDLRKVNPFEPDWARTVYRHLDIFERDLLKASLNGYRRWEDGNGAWSFHSAFYFSLSLITTTGYDATIMRTMWGRISLLLYLGIGIPLNIVWLFHIGSCFADVWIWLLSGKCFFRKRKIQPVTNGTGEQYIVDQSMTRPSSSAILTSPTYVEKHFDIKLNQTSSLPRISNITPQLLFALLLLFLYYIFGSVGLYFHSKWSYLDCLTFNLLTLTTTSTNSIGKIHKVNYIYLFYVIGGYWLISMLSHLFYRRMKQKKQSILIKKRKRSKRMQPVDEKRTK